MKKLYIITAIILCAVSIQAAQLYYQFPDAAKMKATDRMMIWQNNSGNRNLTGAQFQYEALGGDYPMVKSAFSSITSQWAGPNSIHRRISEIRNAAGKIVYYVTAAGRMSIGGQPSPFAVSDIYPANGATGIYNNYSTGTNGSKRFTLAYVTYNKNVKIPSSSTDQYVVGQTQSLINDGTGKYTFSGFSAASGTTYTIKVWLENFRKYQSDGEWTASCPSMTDTGDGYCTSTFSTR